MKKWMKFVWVAFAIVSLTGCYDRPKEEQKPETPAEAPKTPALSETPAPGDAPVTPPPATPEK